MQRIATGETIYAKDVVLGPMINAGMLTGASNFMVNWYADRPAICMLEGTSIYFTDLDNHTAQTRAFTSDWATANTCHSAILLGSYLYLILREGAGTPDGQRVYRYTASNLAAGGTLMTFSGATTLVAADYAIVMSTDGTYFYFNFNAGNSANDYVIAKYSISGTTFTYVSSTTCGSTGSSFGAFHVRASDGHYLAQSTGRLYRRFNSSGTVQSTAPIAAYTADNTLNYICDWLYAGSRNTTDSIMTLGKLVIT